MLEKSILPLSWFQFQQYFRGKFMATKRSVPFPVVWLIEYWVESENLNSAESNIESNLRIWKTSNRISNRILKWQNVASNIESNLKMRKPSNRISNRILIAKKDKIRVMIRRRIESRIESYDIGLFFESKIRCRIIWFDDHWWF